MWHLLHRKRVNGGDWEGNWEAASKMPWKSVAPEEMRRALKEMMAGHHVMLTIKCDPVLATV
jgi:hypothetical protein